MFKLVDGLHNRNVYTPLLGSSVDCPFPPVERTNTPLIYFFLLSYQVLIPCVCFFFTRPFLSTFVETFLLIMSHTGTFRGTPNKTIGRGKLPDFESPSASHIPRPRPDRQESSAVQSSTNTPASDVGSGTGTMSAASSRQRQNQSKRDEVRVY